MTVEYISLDGTDLRVSRIGFGTEPLGGKDWGRVDLPGMMTAVSRACDLGINLFETADVYGLGQSEQLLSQALGTRRHEVVIISKFGVNWDPAVGKDRARTFYDASPKRVVEALEGSLRRLRIDCIPIYLVHWPDEKTPIETTMDALRRCREAGKVRYVGVSNFPAHLIREAHLVEKIVLAEVQHSLVHRGASEDIVSACTELWINVFAYGPLAQGLLAGTYSPKSSFGLDDRRHRLPHFQDRGFAEHSLTLERMHEISHQYRRSLPQLAIRWVLDTYGVSGAISGVKTVKQIEDNVRAMNWSLTYSDWMYLAEATAQGIGDGDSAC